jgi:hypothetical protein
LEFNTSAASRPSEQFRYQIIKEMQWLTDEPQYQQWSTHEIEGQAYLSVKHTWKGWKIWDEGWGPIPGSTWPHENQGKGPEATHGGEIDIMNRYSIKINHPTSPRGGLLNAQPRPNDDASEIKNLPADTVTPPPHHQHHHHHHHHHHHLACDIGASELVDEERNRLTVIPDVSQQEQHLTTSKTGRKTGLKSSLQQNEDNGVEDQQQTRAPPRRSTRNQPSEVAEVADNLEQSLATSKTTTKRIRGRKSQPTDAAPEQSIAAAQ